MTRSRRGRGPEHDQVDPLRSRSKDTNLGQDQDIKRSSFVEGGILSEPKSVDTTSMGFRPLFDDDPERYFSSSAAPGAYGQELEKSDHRYQEETLYRSQQQQQQQQFHSRLSVRRPPLDASSHSDSTLFASSQGVLVDNSADSDPLSPFQSQKRQRLSSSVFAPRSSAPAAVGANDTAPLNLFGIGRGRDRTSLLVDDPSLVDGWGVPLTRPSQGGPGTLPPAGAGNANGQTAGSESVLSAVFNMAKKRLFWG